MFLKSSPFFYFCTHNNFALYSINFQVDLCKMFAKQSNEHRFDEIVESPESESHIESQLIQSRHSAGGLRVLDQKTGIEFKKVSKVVDGQSQWYYIVPHRSHYKIETKNPFLLDCEECTVDITRKLTTPI